MKGLIRKEYYAYRLNLLWYGAFTLVFFALYAFVTHLNSFFLYYPALLFSTTLISSISVDESDHWDIYAAALPCSRVQLVSVKFLMLLLIACATTLLALIASIMRNPPHDFSVPCLMLIYFLLVGSINLFTTFKWGSQKSRVPSVILTLAAFFLLSLSRLNTLSFPTLILFLTLASVLLFFLLWFLTIRTYQKRDL